MQFEFKPGCFYKEKEGKVTAKVTFTTKNGVMAINHTFVDESLRGRGIAGKLMLAVVDYAQTNDLQIKPVCSYSQAFFERRPEYDDLLV